MTLTEKLVPVLGYEMCYHNQIYLGCTDTDFLFLVHRNESNRKSDGMFRTLGCNAIHFKIDMQNKYSAVWNEIELKSVFSASVYANNIPRRGNI